MIPGRLSTGGRKDRSERLADRPKGHYTFARRGRPARLVRLAVVPRNAAGPCVSSLRLSVRTPPFYGGESGSIPLGSAILSEAAGVLIDRFASTFSGTA